jgi:DNA-binding beta-propeller fold protein YncE
VDYGVGVRFGTEACRRRRDFHRLWTGERRTGPADALIALGHSADDRQARAETWPPRCGCKHRVGLDCCLAIPSGERRCHHVGLDDGGGLARRDRVYAGFNGVGFSIFGRDASTGRLTILGEAPGTPTGGGLFQPSIAGTPDGASLYGVDGQGNRLLQYAPAIGGIVSEQTYPVLADPTIAKDPIVLTVSPDGSSVYVLTYGVQPGTGTGVLSDGKINVFLRDPTTGNLSLVGTTPLDTSPILAGAIGLDPVVSPDGHFVYVVSLSGPGGVYVLSRDPATGALTPLGKDGDLAGGITMAMSPDGNFVYQTGPSSQLSVMGSAISVLARNASTGRLTPVSEVQNGTGGVSGLSDMWGVAVSPDGRCVYATSRADNSLAYFMRDSTTGALTFAGVVTEGGGITGLSNARGLTVSPDGTNVYVASPGDNGLAVFARNSTTCVPTFLQLVQDLFTLAQPAVNQTSGTATLPVNVDTPGTLETSVARVTAPNDARPAASVGR